MSRKQRLSASVDADLLDAARQAVKSGRAESVSNWVDEAMRRQLEHEKRMYALGEFIAAYEAEHGTITEEEMRQAGRKMRSKAIAVRPATKKRPRSRKRSA